MKKRKVYATPSIQIVRVTSQFILSGSEGKVMNCRPDDETGDATNCSSDNQFSKSSFAIWD